MNIKFFQLAKQAALSLQKKTADGVRNKYRVVAVLVPKKGNEIFVGVNKMNETHGASPSPWKSIHAEFDVVNKIGRGYKGRQKIKDSDVYVYRQTSYGQAMAKPCGHCAKLLKNLGVRNIFYSDTDGYYSFTRGKLDGLER